MNARKTLINIDILACSTHEIYQFLKIIFTILRYQNQYISFLSATLDKNSLYVCNMANCLNKAVVWLIPQMIHNKF